MSQLSVAAVAFLLQHRSPTSVDAEKIVCPQCGRSFDTLSSLYQHCADAVHGANGLPLQRLSISPERLPPLVNCMTSSSNEFKMQDVVACSDCGKMFKTAQFLHQHQWDSSEHTRVCQTRTPNPRCECSQCLSKFITAEALEEHFVYSHPFREISQSDEPETWNLFALRFASGWKHRGTALHRIHGIFKVYNPGRRTYGFEQYRKHLKTTTNALRGAQHGNLDLRRKVLESGNELSRFHGTTVKCGLGGAANSSSPQQRLCEDGGCNLCGILRVGFKTSKARMNYFQRFGKGIYVSATSSKANDYVNCMQQLQEEGAGVKKVLLVCRVLAGLVYRSSRNLKHLSSPPAGFHSVQGDPGEDLNYDELVIYDDRAILPSHIIIYSSN